MINLNGLAKVLKGEATTSPVIDSITVQTQKSDELNAGVSKILADAGFAVNKAFKSEDGRTITYSQNGGAPALEGVQLVRLSEQCVLAVKGFQPGHEGMADADFGETASANQYFQGIDGSLDTLFQKICTVVSKATDEKDASKQIATLCDGFKTYAVGLTKGLPTAAFKADMGVQIYLEEKAMAETPAIKGEIKDIEAFLSQLQKAPEGFAEPEWTGMSPIDKITWLQANTAKKVEVTAIKCEPCEGTEGWSGMNADEKQAVHAKHVTKTEIETEPKPKAPKTDAEKQAEKVTGQQEITVKSDDAAPAWAVGLIASVAALTTNVEDIAKKQEDDKKILDALSSTSDDLAKKVESTITAPPRGEDTPGGRQQVAKAEDDPRTGCFDTATISRTKKVELQRRRGIAV